MPASKLIYRSYVSLGHTSLTRIAYPERVAMAIRSETLVRSSIFAVRVLMEHEDDPNVAEVLQPNQRVRRDTALEYNLRSCRRCQRALARRACTHKSNSISSA
jgi:hypothetical protein